METILRIAGARGPHRMVPRWIERAAKRSFAPEKAMINFSRFLERVEETDPRQLSKLSKRNIPWLAALFSGSQALTDMALHSPEWLFWCLGHGVLHSTRFKRDMRHERELMLARRPDDPKTALCHFRNRELMRIGWRDLLKWADTIETLEDLSRLADVSVEGAMTAAELAMTERFGAPIGEDGRPARFIVLGMGKLGGRELNFSSDIDLIYIHDGDGGETEGGVGKNGMERPRISVREFYTRMAQTMTSMLNDIGPAGNLYRVDLGLRPEGSRGPITCSLPAAELYYESWGQPWERQMMIKARVVAGDPGLGDEFLRMVRPFVYRRVTDRSALRDIQQMKEKIDKHLMTGKNRYNNNVKLGKGGIREIEFVIQAHQMIHGGKMPWFAETNSLKALHRIFERGLMGYAAYAQLADALLFLRDLENRMQINYGRQVQILPEGDELGALALKMNLRGADHLMEEYRRHTENVNRIFTDFFREEAAPEGPAPEMFIDVDNAESAAAQLAEMKFARPREALNLLLHIRDGEPFRHPSAKSRAMFMRLLPDLLKKTAAMPLKDRALANLDKFFSTNAVREACYGVLVDFPPALDTLVKTLAYAQNLADAMINHDEALEILSGGPGQTRPAPLERAPDGLEGYDRRLDWLRRERNAESLRIGIDYVAGHRDLPRLMADLSALADAFVQKCLRHIADDFRRQGKGEGAGRFAVIGMGKLGRRELTYGSDLDMMFVYEENGDAPLETQTWHTQLARRLLASVGGISQYGQAYKVDVRLRPEGEKGEVVVSDVAAREYYARRGQLWERMALSGARPVAGDLAFGESFLKSLDSFVYAPGLSARESEAMDAMKKRMERQKIKGPKSAAIKYGPGGIADIEFFTQKLKLARCFAAPDIRPFNTLETLTAAGERGWRKEGIDGLVASYRFLRRVETHIRMEYGRGAETLPDKAEELAALEEAIAVFEPLDAPLADAASNAMARAERILKAGV